MPLLLPRSFSSRRLHVLSRPRLVTVRKECCCAVAYKAGNWKEASTSATPEVAAQEHASMQLIRQQQESKLSKAASGGL
jgi:hypothetical protein